VADLARRLPAAQWALLALCLVALPLANSLALPILRHHLGGSHRRGAWWYHRSALLLVHVALVVAVVIVTRDDGGTRLGVSSRANAWSLVVLTTGLIVASGIFVAARSYAGITSAVLGPVTKNEHWFALLSVAWAGVGQEVLFRSFATPAVKTASGNTFFAVLICAFTFAYYHGGFSSGVLSFDGGGSQRSSERPTCC